MPEHKKEIDLSKLIPILITNKKAIGIVTAITTTLAIIYCIFATPIYTATAVINPPKLTDSGTSFSQVISGMAVISGGGGGLLQKTDADISIAILNTTSVRDLIIKRFNLQGLLEQPNIEKTRRVLSGMVKLIPDMKSGFVSISVDNENPKMAADIANYYTVALGQVVNNIAYARANQRYSFYQEQLESASLALSQSETALRLFSESNGVIAGQQSQVIAGISTQLQARLVSAQIELRRISYYVSPQNPDYLSLESQIYSLKHQLAALNNQSIDSDGLVIPAGLAPNLANQYIRLMRDFKFKELVYEVMLKQSKAAQLDSLSETGPLAIQVIDPAVIPFYKSKPKRLYIIVGSFIFGFLVTALYIMLINRKHFIIEVENEKSVN